MAFLVFLALIIVSQLISARALRSLAPDQKILVTDTQATGMVWPLVALGLAYALLLTTSHRIGFPWWLLPVFMAITILILVVSFVSDVRRLSTAGLPPSYIRTQWFTRILTFVGLLVVFGESLFRSWSVHHR